MFSQNLFNKIYFRLKAGGNFSNLVDTDFETEGLFGYYSGAIIGLKFSDNIMVQEEFPFSAQGAKVKDGFNLFEGDIELSYISVLILLKYYFNLLQTSIFYIF